MSRLCILCQQECDCLEELYVHAVMEHDDKQEATLLMKYQYVNDATCAWLMTQQAQPWGLSDLPVKIPELVRVFGAEDEASNSYGYDNHIYELLPVQPTYSYVDWLSAAINDPRSRTPIPTLAGGKIEKRVHLNQKINNQITKWEAAHNGIDCASQVISQLNNPPPPP